MYVQNFKNLPRYLGFLLILICNQESFEPSFPRSEDNSLLSSSFSSDLSHVHSRKWLLIYRNLFCFIDLDVLELLQTADFLEAPKIKRKCENVLLQASNVHPIDLLKMGEKYNLKSLTDAGTMRASLMKEIARYADFKELDIDVQNKILMGLLNNFGGSILPFAAAANRFPQLLQTSSNSAEKKTKGNKSVLSSDKASETICAADQAIDIPSNEASFTDTGSSDSVCSSNITPCEPCQTLFSWFERQ